MKESQGVSSSLWRLLPPLHSCQHSSTQSLSRLIFSGGCKSGHHILFVAGGCSGHLAGVLHHGLPPLSPLHPPSAGRPTRHLLHPLRACLPHVQSLLRPAGLRPHSWPCLPNPPHSHLPRPSVLYNTQPGWAAGPEKGGAGWQSGGKWKRQ